MKAGHDCICNPSSQKEREVDPGRLGEVGGHVQPVNSRLKEPVQKKKKKSIIAEDTQCQPLACNKVYKMHIPLQSQPYYVHFQFQAWESAERQISGFTSCPV